MALDATIRRAVAIASGKTASLQATVIHSAWIGSDADGAAIHADGIGGHPPSIARQALVEMKQRQLRLPGGQEVTQNALVTFIGPVLPNGAADRREPIDPRDKLVLPSGYTGPVLDVSGLTDPSTGGPYLIECALG